MNSRSLRRALIGASALAWSAAVTPALAEDASGRQNTDTTVKELIVTSQRESQNYLSVSQSITAITSDQLVSSGLNDIASLQFNIPGYVPVETRGSTLIFVRGIGNGLFTGADPSVATYIDDVPRIYGNMVNAFIGVDRVELLKGAQGGLYGRNATGGVLSIVTRQPNTERFEGEARISYGEKNTLQATGYINVPISDKVALNIDVDRETHDPYINNVVTSRTPYSASNFPSGAFLPTGPGGGYAFNTPAQTASFFNSGVNPVKGYDNEYLNAISGKLLIKATNNFRVTLAADYAYRTDSDGNGILQTNPDYFQGVLGGLFGSFFIPTHFDPGFLYSTTQKYTISKAYDSLTTLRDYGTSVTAVLALPGVDITSISAYRRQFSDNYDDLDSVNVPGVISLSTKDAWFFYQEVRAASTDLGRFHVLGGFTYLDDHFGQTEKVGLLPPLYVGPPTTSLAVIQNWSIYAQVRFDITNALNLTVSGRYIDETNHTNFSSPKVSGTSTTETSFLPSATLSYQFKGGGNAYARFAEGFKGGGINPVVPPSDYPNSTGSVFGPESVKTYEVGYRAPLLDRTMQLTAALFYNDYTNLQVPAIAQPQYPSIIYSVINAGTARTWGAEGSVTWRVIQPLTLGVNAGYLDAKYVDFKNTNGAVLVPFDLSGTKMHNSPSVQLSFTGDLEQPINDRFKFSGNILASYSSSILFGSSAVPGVLPDSVQPAFWIVNLRAGIETSDGRYGFFIYANNVFDEPYFTFGGSSGAGGNTMTWGQPRIVGGEVRVRF
jgi:iron complex outermembrane receptor protein